jgi:DNA-directed RNA polymerase specialized sigma24 family protein
MASLQGKTLIERLVARDRSALGELYDRYAGVVNALALRLLPETSDADELVQTVFLSAWRQAGDYDPTGGTPMAWLLAIARERALDRLHGRPASDSAGAPHPPLALGYYEGLTAIELADQFGAPDDARQAPGRAERNERQAHPLPSETPHAETPPE